MDAIIAGSNNDVTLHYCFTASYFTVISIMRDVEFAVRNLDAFNFLDPLSDALC
ncbi:hypothetical protein D3C76_1846580 [compost metagenome]